MDVWVLIFLFTSAYSERLPWGYNGAMLHFITVLLECIVPYMAGRALLEQPGMRIETVNLLIMLMAVASFLGMPQFVLKWNPYIHFWSHFFPGQFPTIPQVRHGVGRVEGPYGMAESNGMVLLIGLTLAFWLRSVGYFGRRFRYERITLIILITTILMTQSRGPWLGLILALSIASIGRAKRPARRAILVFGSVLLVGVPLYSVAKTYINSAPAQVGSEVQTAQYRQQMIDDYVPIAELGGAWGWGNVYPVMHGRFSIDNEYLLIWLTQGYVGLGTLILIFLDAMVSFTWLGIRSRTFQDRYLNFSLLGIFFGMAVCLGTVWLSAQAFMLFFLMVGWSQAIRPASALDSRLQLVRVYT
jgi:hypothetical protein